MIRRYNQSQLRRMALSFTGGLICCFFAYVFFRHIPALVAGQFGFPLTPLVGNIITALGLSAVAMGGYRTWQAGGGLRGYHESSLYHDLGEESAGAVWLDFYAHRITGPAHILSQLFVAGPLLLLRAGTLLASRIAHSAELEGRLHAALMELRKANKWQSISEYPHAMPEILYLARMDLIDFSAYEGRPRIKARLSDGI